MTRAACVLIGLAILTAKAETPTNIRSLADKILATAATEPTNNRFETLLQLASALQFHFPDEAKNVGRIRERSGSSRIMGGCKIETCTRRF